MVKISKSVIGQKLETARAVSGLVFGLGPQKGRGLFGLGPQKGRGLFVWKTNCEFVFPQAHSLESLAADFISQYEHGFSFDSLICTSSEAQLVAFQKGDENSFLGSKAEMKLTHSHLMLRLRKSGSLPLLNLLNFMCTVFRHKMKYFILCFIVGAGLILIQVQCNRKHEYSI